MAMNPGERQVAPTLDGIRRDHVARYEWVAKSILSGSTVIDFACGIGYGSSILADAGCSVTGLDVDEDALRYAGTYYLRPRVVYGRRDARDPGELRPADAAVCFETIEHVEDPRPLLRALHASAPLLFASVPNEAVMPWRHPDGRTTAHHFRHYTKGEFKALLEECGWRPVEWYGQADHLAEVEPDVNGRTLIAICKRAEQASAPIPTDGKHIAILGLGPSIDQYLDYTKRLGGRSAFCDEVWAINALGNVLDCDMVFHMDDVRVQERRAEAAPDSNIASLVRWLKTSRVPVMTSRAHPEYPALVEFPLEAVLNDMGHDYFNSTAAYAVAYAIHVGATKISCFGMDFTYPNSHQAEKGRACVEFWLGIAKARGIQLSMPKTTTLMDAMCARSERLYGYDSVDVGIECDASGAVRVSMTPHDRLPTAEEIEARYDHSKHPNALVGGD